MNTNQNLEKVGKNRTWQLNHEIIEIAFLKLIEENKWKKLPTVRSMVEATGLSDSTIETHWNELSYHKFKPKLKTLTPSILMRLGEKAMKQPKAPEVKLWMELIEDVKSSSNLNIQITSIMDLFAESEDETEDATFEELDNEEENKLLD